MLAFTGRFDVDLLRQTLNLGKPEDDPEDTASDSEENESPASASEQKRQRQLLYHAKAEAKAAFNEGARLAAKRDNMTQGGASQPAGSDQKAVTFSKNQLEILQKWDCGLLRDNLNNAIVELGHGCLRSKTGNLLEIGGITRGGSRRVIDGWEPPDWREFLNCDDYLIVG